ncbi:MAG TPA: ATP-binding cassette domain-containing protein [Rhizobiales bacterium]|nr:ATP-binding cassette domain-containing protein [Hyphomicrobiales bacterium]
MDDQLVQGERDGGDRPTVRSLRNRLRAENENAGGAGPRPKRSWLRRKAKPKKSDPPAAPSPAPASAPAEARSAARAKERPKAHNLGGFLEIFKEGLRLPAPIIVASVVSSLLGLALPLAVLQIYDRILPNQSVDTLTLLTLGLFVAFALDALLKVMRSYLLGWSAVHSGFDAQLTAVTRLLRAPHARVEKEPPATWVDGLEAVRELSAFEGGQSRLLTLDIPLAGIFLIMLGLVAGPLIIVPILLIIGFGALAAIHGSRLQNVLAVRSEQDNRKHDFLVECLSGIHTLKGLAMEPMILRRFERLQKGSAVASYDTILLGNNLQSMGILFANLMMISVVSVGALLVMAGSLSIGGLACSSLLSGRLTQPVLRGIHMWTEFQNIKLAQERAGKFDDLEAGDSAVAPAAGEITGAIDLNDVAFQYSGTNKNACLAGISLQVAPGEFVGIRGESGSGRSTLVKLITGELEPTSGGVVIGGLASQPDREHLQVKGVAYVSANTATFRGTILENITMFRPGAAVEAAQQAAKLIGLEEDIHRLPDGYDTPLSQGVAQELSSGMLQRISIARALARNPKILIFDEANTLLDFRSDGALRQGLLSLKGRVTVIIVSNRPSFLSLADRVYALKDGTLELQREREETRAAQTPVQGSAA